MVYLDLTYLTDLHYHQALVELCFYDDVLLQAVMRQNERLV